MPDTFETINPATEEIIAEHTYFSAAEISNKIEEAHTAWSEWKTSDFAHRSQLILKLAGILKDEKDELGKLITTEMGKPVSQSVAEIEKCAWVCEYYAENAATFLEDTSIQTEGNSSFVNFSPLGLILAIMPWNFPFWQVFRFAVPAVMAGNGALLKHSPNTTGCALKIEELFARASFPDNLFTTLLADIPEMESIIGNPRVAAVTLTGSTGAGKSVASLAGKYLKKTVLELGGSDPYIILDDADLDQAAKACVAGRILNTGQSCIAAKRFIVTLKNEEAFTKKVKTLLQTKKTLDPFDDAADLGPMARKDLKEQLHQQVQESLRKGARQEHTGQIPDSSGYFYPLILLTNVKKGMPAYSEELFGPVATIITAKDEEEAIRIANDTSYGLGSAIFSTDTHRASEIAKKRIEAGACFINEFVQSDPRLPFGGIKESGYGRELSILGIREFVNAKTIFIK